MPHPIDDPRILSNLFYVRKIAPDNLEHDHIYDGLIPVAEGIALGYRLYRHRADAPVILYFHGNGEIATDYELIAPLYYMAGASLLVVDYRGYGWSTGVPLASTLLTDAAAVLSKLPDVLAAHGVGAAPLIVKGRSLGSAPAIYLAAEFPDLLRGLIVESGYAEAPSLFRRLGIAIPDDINDDPTLPVNNLSKIARVRLPVLFLHGEQDDLIPLDNAQRLHAAAPGDKSLVTIPDAGHNDLLFRNTARYFDAVRRFVQRVTASEST